MPAFVDRAVALIRSSGGHDTQEILEAIRLGCTDAEIAGLLGMTPPAFDALLLQDPRLKAQVDALRARRRLGLRRKINEIVLDDDHPAQGRILDRILTGEIQAEQEEASSAETWVAIAKLANIGGKSSGTEQAQVIDFDEGRSASQADEGEDEWDL